MPKDTPNTEQTLREQLLGIDTSYAYDDDHKTVSFLPPNFYVDRLVEFIEEREKQAAERTELAGLVKLEEWFQQYGYEMHVSHVCPAESIACAKFAGRSQKAQQIHEEINRRLAELQKEKEGKGDGQKS